MHSCPIFSTTSKPCNGYTGTLIASCSLAKKPFVPMMFLRPLKVSFSRNAVFHPTQSRPLCCAQTPGKPKTIGIAGGGIGGLSTALCLLRTPGTGVRHVSIFEPRETLDTGLGGLLNINGGAAVLAKYYDIDVWKIGNDTKNIVARDTSGSILFHLDISKQLDSMPTEKELLAKNGRPAFMSVMRDGLQELLYESIRSNAISIHRGPKNKVIGVDEDGDKPFFLLPNGNRSRAFDLVVGADGIRSNVRSFVTGTAATPEYSGIRVQWAINPPGSCSLESNLIEQYFGDGGYALRYAAGPPNALTEAVVLSFCDRERGRENVSYLTEKFVQKDMEVRLRKCGMPQNVLDAFENGSRYIDTSVYYHNPIQSWSRGYCTLVGDSGMYPKTSQFFC